MKYTVTFPKKVDERMVEIAEEESISKPEVIRRALALYSFVHKEKAKGSEFIIRDKSDNEKEIVFQ